MKDFLKWLPVVLVLGAVLYFGKEYNQKKEREEIERIDKVSESVEVLDSDKAPSVGYNIHFLVENPEMLNEKFAADVANVHCGENCNNLYFWKSKDAFALLKHKRTHFMPSGMPSASFEQITAAQKQWEREDNHWIDICENLLATYHKDEGLYTFPYAREVYYQELGGKMRFSD